MMTSFTGSGRTRPPWNLDSVTRPTIRFGRVTRKVQFLTLRVGRLLTHPQKATSPRPSTAIPVNPRTCSGRWPGPGELPGLAVAAPLSDQLSDDRDAHARTPTDVVGRSSTGQARHGPLWRADQGNYQGVPWLDAGVEVVSVIPETTPPGGDNEHERGPHYRR